MRSRVDIALWSLLTALTGAAVIAFSLPRPSVVVPQPEAAAPAMVEPVTVFVPLVALIGENPPDIYFCVPSSSKPRLGCEGISAYYRTEAECTAMRADVIGRELANHRTVSSDCIAKPLVDKAAQSVSGPT